MAINYVNRTHYECDQCGVDEEFDEGDVAEGYWYTLKVNNVNYRGDSLLSRLYCSICAQKLVNELETTHGE